MAKSRSFLKWAGSKYNCLNKILPALGTGKRLIEPFAGSGVVFLNTDFSSYLLAEENKDLINIFKILQKDVSFINFCQQFFTPETNKEEVYYELRQEFNELKQSQKKSALFLYLNRHGYNGLCRYNSSGIFNVPFGRYTKTYFPLTQMHIFHQKSQTAEFIHHDFRETFKLAQPGDVIYCDPPYVPLLEKTKPVAYTKKIFSEQDQIELAQLASETAAKGIPVIISNHDTEFTRHHYRNASIISFRVSRFINCQINMRNPANELVAIFN
ncbi:MAG: Dam family site-specific DNA-(adenine-N6)-methyltransferase [Legionella sp.]